MWGRWPWAAARRFRSSPCATPTPRTWRRTVAQILRLEQAGCEIVRRGRAGYGGGAGNRRDQTRASTSRWSRTSTLTISLALECVAAGGGQDPHQPRQHRRARSGCAQWPTRAASGASPSASASTAARWRRSCCENTAASTAEALVESALGHVRLLNDCGFDDICISVKCSRRAG